MLVNKQLEFPRQRKTVNRTTGTAKTNKFTLFRKPDHTNPMITARSKCPVIRFMERRSPKLIILKTKAYFSNTTFNGMSPIGVPDGKNRASRYFLCVKKPTSRIPTNKVKDRRKGLNNFDGRSCRIRY